MQHTSPSDCMRRQVSVEWPSDLGRVGLEMLQVVDEVETAQPHHQTRQQRVEDDTGHLGQ